MPKTLAVKSDKIIFVKTIDIHFFGVYNADKFFGSEQRYYALQNKRNSIQVFWLLLLFRREINSRSDFCCAEKAFKSFESFAVESLQGSYFFKAVRFENPIIFLLHFDPKL